MSDLPAPTNRANQLLAAGFSPDEVGAWATQQRQTLTGAGFSEPEIDAYIGGQPPKVPQVFLDRVSQGTAVGRVLKAIGEGASEGFGAPQVMAPETEQFWRDIGVFTRPGQPHPLVGGEPIRAALELATKTVSAAYNYGGAAVNALVNAAGRGVGQAAEEAGVPMAQRLGEETTNLANFIMAESMAKGPIARVARGPTGAPEMQPIGGLPKAESFSEATRSTLGPQPAPQAYAKVEQLWNEQGIHPAEVAHDAGRDVTISQDLAGGRMPEAYGPPVPSAEVSGEALVTPQAPATPIAEPRPPEAPAGRPVAGAGIPPEPSPLPGGPPQIRAYQPSELRVDPQRFQFKEGGDDAGVSQRLAGVTQWDPIKAGIGIVWEDEGGNPYIVDGHQRLGLANRIAANDPTQSPALNAWTLRAADGVTDTEARAIAASKNIAEGTGTPVDAAKVLRDRPDLLPSLPPRSEVVRQAQGLMNLDDDAFGKVVNDVVPANYGAIVGRLAPDDPVMQSALIDLLHETAPENITQAESIVRQGLDAGVHEATQQTLFGSEQMVSSLFGERARVLDRALKQLRRDRTVFQSIVDNSAIIEELGNQLARDENLRRAAVDGRAAQIIQTLANRRGPLSDALTAAARSIADGSATPAAAARDFVAEIRRQTESGDIARLANGGERGAVATAGAGRPGAAVERGVRDVAPAEEASATEATQAALQPATEQTAQGEQLVIPGAERSAVQAAASREAEGRGRIAPPTEQEAPGGLFAPPPETASPTLFRRIMEDESGTLRLKRPEPPRTDAENAILSRLSIGETDKGRAWSWHRFYAAVVDRLNPLQRVTKELAPGEKLTAADDPYKVARLYAGVSGKADHFLNYGTFRFGDYATTGKSFQEILAPVTEDLAGFRAYASSLRALELEAKGIKTGMDLAAARDVATAGQAKYAPIMAELVQYQNRVLQYLRDSGVISAEGFDAMTHEHLLYVPFQRVFGDVMGDIIPDVIRGQGKTLQASDPIHEIVGSVRRVIDPLESIIRNTYLSVMMAERNAVGTKLFDLIDRAGGLPTPERGDTISFYRNGVKETHTVDTELATAMKGLDEESANTLLRFLGAPARMLRAGATLTPDFMARNLIRDFFSAVVNTQKGIFSPIDTAKGLMSAISRDAYYQEWLKSGGANAALVSLDRRYLQQNISQLTADTGLGTRAWNVVRHPIETLRAVSQLSEEATRVGEFRGVRERALAAGATAKEAAQEAGYSSREVTLDFSRRGSATRGMNMITAFWNAQVQGVDRLARAFHDDPVGTSLKIAAGVTLPSVLLWMNNHNDPRWKEIPDWERDLFWIVLTGQPNDPNATIYRIPKPFETGVIFGSGVERLLDAFADQKPEAFNDFVKSVAGALLPGMVPTMGIPMVEQFANRSTFLDRPLIPQSMEKIMPEYQYTPYTTETAKALGQILGAFPGIKDTNIGDSYAAGVARALSTPILMENYLRAWTGGLGVYALQIADAGLRKEGILPDPVKPDDTLADIPFVKAFVVRYPTAGAESIQRFYDEYTRSKTYFDTWMNRAKEGDIAGMQHVQEMGGLRTFVQLDSVKDALGLHAKLVRDIYKDANMTPSDKRQQIDQIYYRMTETAAFGMNVMLEMMKPHQAAVMH